MRVLIVARFKNGRYAPFISEQVEALKQQGVVLEFFPITRNGIFGYRYHLPRLKETIKQWKPDLIHAHYGLCGLLANMQHKVPVVTTYHGSDINDSKVRRLSRIAIRLSAYNIFVSQKCVDIITPKKKYALIPCGINLNDYPFINKSEARRSMGLEAEKKYILFAGAFDNTVKNAPLAIAAAGLVEGAELLELKGYSRAQVNSLMHAVDAFLMTSFTEGSPQVIKEAMACGCPIVSVNVGDVRETIEGVDGCYISETEPNALAENIRRAISFNHRTSGMEVIIQKGLTNDLIAKRLIRIYNSI